MPRLKVAAAQIECRPGDLAANVDLHLDAIAQAKAAGADLVVFPELSLTGYDLDPNLRVLAIDRHAPQIVQIADVCQDVVATVGFIEVLDGRFYNSAATLSEGRIQAVHRKISLPTYGRLREGDLYTPGTSLEVHRIGQWNTATMICADNWDPALAWLLALKGCDLLLLPIASGLNTVDTEFGNPAGWDVNLRHTAMTYGLPIVMCNHCGSRSGLTFWGGSRILDAHGKVLSCAADKPEIVYAEIHSDDVALARARLPTMKMANPKLVSDLLQRIIGDTAPPP